MNGIRDKKLQDIGLVFAGGGGKGAYEIGVWKYLHELGLEQYVRVVSGTSVGALNAALFVGGNYQLAEKLWLDITPKKILTPKKLSLKDVIKALGIIGIMNSNPITRSVGTVASIIAPSPVLIGEKIARLLMMKISSDSLFSREGLLSMIAEGVNFEQLRNSKIPCYVTCLRCPMLKLTRFELNGYNDSYIKQILLASSAIPVVFSNEKIGNRKYCDGGVPILGDNVPITPVYDTKVKNIIVVNLGGNTVIDKKEYPNARVIEIIPSEDLGNALSGTLDFTPEGAKRRIELGYADAKRTLQCFVTELGFNA